MERNQSFEKSESLGLSAVGKGSMGRIRGDFRSMRPRATFLLLLALASGGPWYSDAGIGSGDPAKDRSAASEGAWHCQMAVRVSWQQARVMVSATQQVGVSQATVMGLSGRRARRRIQQQQEGKEVYKPAIVLPLAFDMYRESEKEEGGSTSKRSVSNSHSRSSSNRSSRSRSSSSSRSSGNEGREGRRLDEVGNGQRLLAEVHLHGGIRNLGYYYTQIFLGTPPQKFSLVVDTGSSVTNIPCAPCTACSLHQNSAYHADSSSSAAKVLCTSDRCPLHSCDTKQNCLFSARYEEGSSFKGFLTSDSLSFGNISLLPETAILFACRQEEEGFLRSQKADGFLGLGRGPFSMVDQLASRGIVEDEFSLCYGGMDEGGGVMVLGRVERPDSMDFTPFDIAHSQSSYYQVSIQGIDVAGRRLQIDRSVFSRGFGSVVDSGSTFIYLPSAAYEAVVAKLSSHLSFLSPVEGGETAVNEVCYGGAPTSLSQLHGAFPTLSLEFRGETFLHLAPENYLFRHRTQPGAYCLGIFPSSREGTVIGAIAFRNTLVTFDRLVGTVGFWKTPCRKLLETDKTGDGRSQESDVSSSSNPSRDRSSSPSESLPADSISAGPYGGSSSGSNSGSSSGAIADGEDGEIVSATPVPYETSFHVMDATGCKGCAGSIAVSLTLAIEEKTFKAHRSEFRNDLLGELFLEPDQILVKGAEENESGGITVRILIVPYDSVNFIPEITVQRVLQALHSHQVVLRDAFGPYNITSSWTTAPPYLRPRSVNSMWLWFVMGAVLLAAVGVLLLFVWWKRAQDLKSAKRYATMTEMQRIDSRTGACDERAAIGAPSGPQ